MAGLQAGDVIINFAGTPVRYSCDLIGLGIGANPDSLARCQLDSAPELVAGSRFSITYLRLNADGTFSRHETSITRQEGFGFGFINI